VVESRVAGGAHKLSDCPLLLPPQECAVLNVVDPLAQIIRGGQEWIAISVEFGARCGNPLLSHGFLLQAVPQSFDTLLILRLRGC
jgi:hypothetical protein